MKRGSSRSVSRATTLRFFRIDLGELAAAKLAALWEKRTLGKGNGKGPGLYRIDPGAELALQPLREGERLEPGEKPFLIFLHGTASSTTGSFGELWESERREIREELLKPYPGRVLALEHQTLTRSPVENAIDLVERLPTDAHLHLISHSRGGLVGELLCRACMSDGGPPFDEDDFALFPEGDDPDPRTNLRRLNKLLIEKRVLVDRFVRVACPACGTTLASERLDIYLSLILNLIEKLPYFKVATDVQTELIMAIAKERSDPRVLPGLEAQIPGSPLVRVLNRPDRTVAGELRVIAGDIEGKNAISIISTLLTDPLYQGDHDLVVDTLAMLGGAERAGKAAGYSFHHGASVSHFRYFKNEDSASRLLRALTRKENEDDGFKPFSVRELDEGEPPYRRADGGPRPVVFLLPGIMGSHLSVGHDRIWLDPRDLAFGGFGRLNINEGAVQAGPPMWFAYSKLVRWLSTTHEVESFPYDWRLSVMAEANRLAERVQLRLEQAEKYDLPVSLIGHSMGGLVARAMITRHGDIWNRMKRHPNSRLLMLGTPNGGSHAIARVLLGRDSLIKKLAILDIKLRKKDLLNIVSQFPGVLELLPNAGTLDLLDPATWEEIAAVDAISGVDDWVQPTRKILEDAKNVQARLAEAIDGERMLYVAGQALATPVDLIIEQSSSKRRLSFQATAEGDGRVPWTTGQLPGVKTWYMPAAHGDLANHEPSFPALTELLERGYTDLLNTAPPVVRRAPERFEMPEERTPLYPTAKDLARSALGAGKPAPESKVYPRAKVRIYHGNLAHARYPVMVGHYTGDIIVSAEAYLNSRVLDGRLEARLALGLYPGPPDSEEVFLINTPSRSSGAIVLGLGQVGDLSPGSLMRAVSRGARKLALTIKECNMSGGASTEVGDGSGITALLVGSGAGGLPVDECVTQILRGIADANRALSDSKEHAGSWIREVEFVELYEDRAIQAAHALRRARHDQLIADFFDVEAVPYVESRTGGRRRASLAGEDPWWQRLQITEDKQGQLRFNRLTDRARTEVALVPTQREFVDAFIDDATETTNTDEKVAVTLFEMLIPNALKAQTPDRRSLVLLLDKGSARFPRELLRERSQSSATIGPTPFSVEAGVIRQLDTEHYRRQPVMALGKSALVVGNPVTTRFSSLPGAETEAKLVANLLDDKGFAITLLVGDQAKLETSGFKQARHATAKAILHALYEREYRIVHLAGHGVYENLLDNDTELCSACGQETGGKRMTGMVLGDQEFLTPALMEQMQAVPELVFINCCHLGKSEKEGQTWKNRPSRLAANLATQLIQMGVRAVVAAGWAVDDKAAETFAQAFYEQMLTGAAFGDAVKTARAKTYGAYPGVNTWGAYQCYGDPGLTLSKAEGGRRLQMKARKILSRAECQVELENIAEDASTAEQAELEALRARVRKLEKEFAPDWNRCSNLIAALGRAYGELGQFKEAIERYQRALKINDASLPLRAVEQLCNLETRYAANEFLDGRLSRDDSLKKLLDASKRLEALIQYCGSTAERQGVRGSIAKRQAMMESSLEGKRMALEEMGKAYHHQKSAKTNKPSNVDPYTFFNALTADVLLSLLSDNVAKPPEIDKDLNLAIDSAADHYRRQPSFWNAVVRPDCLLLQNLADRDLNEATVERRAEEYLELRNRGASPREFQSVLGQLDFYINVLAVAPNENIRQDLANAIVAVKAKLKT